MKEISRAYEPSFIDYEEKQLQKIQNKIDQFQVDVHPAVRLRNFENTGRGLCATKNIVKGSYQIRVKRGRRERMAADGLSSCHSLKYPMSRKDRPLSAIWTVFCIL